MTGKRTTQDDSGAEPVAVVEEQSAPPVVDLRVLYADAIKNLEAIAAAMAAQGIDLGPAPPVAISSVKPVGSGVWTPTGAGGPNENNTSDMPWSSRDLNPEDKYSFVPQFIPGLVGALLDANRKPKIFFTVNGMTCCLTVGVLNENISGMFYWAYMNAEAMYNATEAYKENGPQNAPWSSQGPGGTSSWHQEPVAPNAWIDLDGRYYTPGAPMPDTAEG